MQFILYLIGFENLLGNQVVKKRKGSTKKLSLTL
ncbi:hypothetical protein SAMN06265346_11035 [Flavobacterium hercynium]|nr:hypothetical protein SAMN06265346_11035 [Flavobacterium hercynium]